MCFGSGGQPNSPSPEQDEAGQSARQRALDEARAGGEWDTNVLGAAPEGWDTMSSDQKAARLANVDTSLNGLSPDGQNTEADISKGYRTYRGPTAGYDPYSGLMAGGPPQQADLTDQLLQKTRTNFALRLQAGSNQASSFGGSSSGGLVLGGSKAGGY